MARRKKSGDNPAPNLTPMIDIIFQLLIFFLVGTKFRSLEAKLVTNLPRDMGIEVQKIDIIPPEPLRIYLSLSDPENDDSVLVQVGNRLLGGGFPDLARELHDFSRAPDRLPDDVRVVIDAVKDVQFRHVMTVLDICQGLGIEKTQFAAPPAITENK